MSNLAIKLETVQFHNQQITVLNYNNKPYVAMKSVVENIGLNWHAQLNRIHRHHVLSKAVAMIATPSKGGIQEYACLPLSMINGWLFGIDVNRVRENLRPALIKYQEECFDVLYEYWTTGEVKRNREISTHLLMRSKPTQIEIDCYNINALVKHYEFIMNIYMNQIDPALRQIESPLAGRIIDHVKDGSIFAHYVQNSLMKQLPDGATPRIM